MRKIQITKKNKQIYITLTVFFVALAIILYRTFSIQTIISAPENYIIEEDIRGAVFKSEEYVKLKSASPIKFTLKEGEKVSAHSLLSKNYQLNTKEYVQKMLDVLDFCLSKNSYDSKEEYLNDLSEQETIISELEQELSKDNMTAEKKKELQKKQSKALDKRELLQDSAKYIFADNSTLKQLKKEYNNRLKSKSMKLTPSNLNFSYPGYISYKRDGYEEVLNTAILDDITPDYMEYIADFNPAVTKNSNEYVVKISKSTCNYIAFATDSKIYVKNEKQAVEYKKKLEKDYKINKYGGYYPFLESRIDIIDHFPAMDIQINDKLTVTGTLVNVIEQNGKKVFVVAIRKNLDNLENIRVFDGQVHTEEYNAYVVPESAIITKNKKTYIKYINDGNASLKTAVNVLKYHNGNAILLPEDNRELYENIEIITNP